MMQEASKFTLTVTESDDLTATGLFIAAGLRVVVIHAYGNHLVRE